MKDGRIRDESLSIPPIHNPEKCSDLLMKAPVGVFTSTPEGTLLYANECLAGLFGYETPHQMVAGIFNTGRQIYTDPADRQTLLQLLEARQTVSGHECRMTRRDGSVFWASITIYRESDENGRPYLHGFVSDITGRKQAEEKFSRVFMTASDCIAIIRMADSVVCDLNDGFQETTGWSRNTTIGESSLQLGFWPDPEDFGDLVATLRSGQDVVNREFTFRRSDGELREGVFSARSLPLEGEPHFMLVMHDLTQSKLSDESLRLTQFAMDKAADSILWVDDTGRLIYANEAACTSMRFTREELLGMRVFDVDPDFHESDWEQHKKDMKRLGKMTFEGRHRTRDGGLFPVEVTTNYIEYKGRFLGIAFDRDITERKRSEEERDRLQKSLFQAQKMESLGILAGGVAHDFNNLLQIVGGNIEVLLAGKRPKHPDTARLRAASRSISRAGKLVQQLLLFGRKAIAQRTPLDLNREVRESLRILERTIPKMIRIENHLENGLWPVAADPVQVEQVLLNLGANAVDAMAGDGSLVVETKNLMCDPDTTGGSEEIPPGRYVLLTVSDTGCGMNAEVLGRVFDPFFTTKEAGRGTGLGLATTYGIVKAHGGYIQCRSKPGQGTTFLIFWPALEGSCPLENAAGTELPSGGSEVILVVDDEPDILDLTREYLESLGYRVLQAGDGESALETMDNMDRIPDLVLLDLNMPGMGGMQCLHRMLERNRSTRILVSSGYMEEDRSCIALASGAGGFIAKPYLMTDLATTIREILDGVDG